MNIWITGGSSGIGAALAVGYLAKGHQVFVTARSASRLDELEKATRNLPGTLLCTTADVCDLKALSNAYQQMVDKMGAPDLVILNAGTHRPTSARRFDIEIHRDLMDVNYYGVLNGIAVVIEAMRARGRGQIAIVSSLAGYRGLPGASAYGASKAALINFAESIREELCLDGLDVRLINPGFVKTPLTDLNDFPMPFLISAEDAAHRIMRGLAGKDFEITFPFRFALLMKVLRLLPDRLFLAFTRRLLRSR